MCKLGIQKHVSTTSVSWRTVRMGLNLVKVFKNTSTSIPDLIEYGIEMVETVHQGPHKGFKMDIIFDNWARRSRVVN